MAKKRTYVEMLDALGMEILIGGKNLPRPDMGDVKKVWSNEARTAYDSLLRVLRKLDKLGAKA